MQELRVLLANAIQELEKKSTDDFRSDLQSNWVVNHGWA